MSLFINQDQIFAHQVHLLEHKLRSKEERILELETEKAILHLRLAEREAQRITQLTLGKLLAEVQELRGNIRVHCRGDLVRGGHSCQRGHPAINKVFEFERVHGPEDSQNVVFEEVKPLLTSLLDGYNVCIMAYEQTGSGKTHTMMGSQRPPGSPQPRAPQCVSSPGDQQGIIPQAAVELFRLISGKPSERHVVEVSVVEVYNNEVFDLLSCDGEGGAPGQRRDVITTASPPSLMSGCVKSAPEVMQLVWAVVKLRARCPTLVHAHSSRSHLVVTLTVSSNSPHALALARHLKSAKQELQRCPTTDFWNPRCRRANGAPRHASADHSAATASPSSSFSFPGHSQCPSPRPGRAQGPVSRIWKAKQAIIRT
ncbi:unnamed protein product [Boreogadus saida]